MKISQPFQRRAAETCRNVPECHNVALRLVERHEIVGRLQQRMQLLAHKADFLQRFGSSSTARDLRDELLEFWIAEAAAPSPLRVRPVPKIASTSTPRLGARQRGPSTATPTAWARFQLLAASPRSRCGGVTGAMRTGTPSWWR